MKRLLIGLVLLLLLLAVAVVGLLLFVDPNDYKDQIADQVRESTGMTLTIDGPIEWSLWPSVALELSDVTVMAAPPFDNESLLVAGRLSTGVALMPLFKKALVIESLTVVDAQVQLLTDAQGRSNLDALLGTDEPSSDQANGPSPQADQLRVGEIRLESVQLRMRDLRSGADQLIRVDQATLQRFEIGQPAAFELQGSYLDAGTLLIDDLRLSGQLVINEQAPMLSLDDLRAEARLAGLDMPLIITGDLSVDTTRGIKLSLDQAMLSLDKQSFALDLQIDVGDQMNVDVTLSGESLDLDRLISRLPSESPAQASSGAQSDDLAWLNGLSLDGSVSIDQVTLNGLELKQCRATLRARNGVLDINSIQASSFSGQLLADAQIDARSSPPMVSLSPRLSGIDIGALSQQATDTSLVRTSGDLSMSLSGRGLDPEGLINTLDGTGDYEFSAGSIAGIDINRLVEELIAMNNLAGLSGAFDGETPFDQMSGTLSFDQGTITSPSLRLATDSFIITGSGALNLLAAELDYQIQLELLGVLREQFVSRYGQYSQPIIPLQINGPIASPSINFDLQAFIRQNAGARIEQEKDALKDKLKNRLLDRLRGDDDDNTQSNDGDRGQ